MVGGTGTIGALDECIAVGMIVVVEPEGAGDGARGAAVAGAGGAAAAGASETAAVGTSGVAAAGGASETGGAMMTSNVVGGCCRRVYTYVTRGR